MKYEYCERRVETFRITTKSNTNSDQQPKKTDHLPRPAQFMKSE